MFNKGNKKGISPLIATVLIVGFVIALSGIFWGFFRTTVQEQMDKKGAESDGASKCPNVNIQFVKCENGNKIKFKNTGSENIAGLIIRVEGIGGSATAKSEYAGIKSGDSASYNVPSGSSGTVIPIVAAKGYAYPCSQFSDKIVSFKC